MFARILELTPMFEKKDELIRVVKNEVLPILKKQHGFLELLPFTPEMRENKMISISLWADKNDALRYEKDTFAKVEQIIKPYLTKPITARLYTVETTICEHFEKALAA